MSLYGGVDLGGTKIQTVVVDGDGAKVVGKARAATPSAGGPPAVVEAIEQAVRAAAAQAGIDTRELAGLGVGAPGEVDPASGTLLRATNLAGWTKPFALGPALTERLGPPTALGNDVDVATLAEHELGAGRGVESLLGVFWGTGVGGALILDGRLWRGRGGAGEIGHMVVRLGGARCPCGRRGCLEAYAGRRAMELKALREVERGRESTLFEIMRERGRETLASSVWARALEEGDGLARHLIDRAVRALGAGIASAINLLDLELVLIGGGLGTRFGRPMAARIAEAMSPHLFNDGRPPEVRVAELGDLGGSIGATLISRRAVH